MDYIELMTPDLHFIPRLFVAVLSCRSLLCHRALALHGALVLCLPCFRTTLDADQWRIAHARDLPAPKPLPPVLYPDLQPLLQENHDELSQVALD